MKAPYVFPIIGGRKIEHLQANIEALSIDLNDEDIREIEQAAPMDLGYPHRISSGQPDKHVGPSNPTALLQMWCASFEGVAEQRVRVIDNSCVNLILVT